ncbi:hypothetical protein LDENG_00091460 [Lucifuga dentata]|nr:hypothetical protein LDENG_00091460 [Lucifuga dentata]
MPLPTTWAPLPGTVRHAHPDTSPPTRPSTVLPGPLTVAAGAGPRQGTAWRAMGLSMSETTSMNATTNPLHMSRAFPMEIHTRMVEIPTLTPTHAPLGLPATGLLHPLIHIHEECPMATARPHLPRTGEGHQGHRPTHITGHPIPEGPARACTNLIVRRMRMTGASDHRERGMRAGEEKNSSLPFSGLGSVDSNKAEGVKEMWGFGCPPSCTPQTLKERRGRRGGGEG